MYIGWLMKNDPNCFLYFKLFFNEIKTQSSISIRALHNDNACEYLSN